MQRFKKLFTLAEVPKQRALICPASRKYILLGDPNKAIKTDEIAGPRLVSEEGR